MRILVYLFCLFLLPIRGLADSCHAIAINGLTRINASLTLGELIDKAAQGVPEMSLVQAKSDEAAAYRDYADSLFAGSHVAQIGYLDHEPIDGSGQKQFDFSITVQPWQWGENSAVERIANAAGTEHNLYREFVRYSVAGLVRESLWRIALASFEREKVMQQLGLVSDLLDVVTTRVRSGDLAETDLLLARSEFLASKAELIRANGKLGHVVYAYQSITGVDEIPGQFEEVRDPIVTIDSSHIAIRVLNMLIEKDKAKISLIRYQTNSQFLLGLGYIRQQETWGSPAQNSLSVSVDVPFGAPRSAEYRNCFIQCKAQRSDRAARYAAAKSSVTTAESEP
jgi:hypothetical protein